MYVLLLDEMEAVGHAQSDSPMLTAWENRALIITQAVLCSS